MLKRLFIGKRLRALGISRILRFLFGFGLKSKRAWVRSDVDDNTYRADSFNQEGVSAFLRKDGEVIKMGVNLAATDDQVSDFVFVGLGEVTRLTVHVDCEPIIFNIVNNAGGVWMIPATPTAHIRFLFKFIDAGSRKESFVSIDDDSEDVIHIPLKGFLAAYTSLL
ncbi:hypothetical protein A134_23290 [Vibrio crassostreae 9CS106]|uniref:Uncharacterized protein n=1 Tax=Vibrio crassostreae 9CS106 TaxID=1191300 RepID=A0A1B1C3B0_9VIBR|nr:hypothetical protein A134_23290 [Vibrio crassostreae 9CS106]